MCTGRVSVSHLPEAFRFGANMVWISGCRFVGCHYVDGNTAFERRYVIAKKIIRRAGLNPDRLQFTQISASEGAIYADNVRRLIEIID
jgi:coenzyme F420-reducing hydrogenase delta subunit